MLPPMLLNHGCVHRGKADMLTGMLDLEQSLYDSASGVGRQDKFNISFIRMHPFLD